MTGNEEESPQLGGPTLGRVTNGIVRLHARHSGKGSVRARLHLIGDLLVCVLDDAFIPAERTLIACGEGEAVQAMRGAWQDAMRDDFAEIAESATGRPVRALLSQVRLEPDVHIEMFIFEPVAVPAPPNRASHSAETALRREYPQPPAMVGEPPATS